MDKLPITTPRLIIRAPLKKDMTDIFTALQESRPELEQWMSWARPWPDKDVLKGHILKSIEDFKTGARHRRFECFDKETGRFVVSLGCSTEETAGHFHISYWTRTDATGKGYATEAVNGLARYLFAAAGATHLESGYELGNIGSKRVLEKCGFYAKGTNKKVLGNGKIRLERLCLLTDPATLPALDVSFG